MRQDVSEHRRPSLHENQRREKAARLRQQHARPCSPRGPAGRRGASAQGRCRSCDRQNPAGWDRGVPWASPHHPICRTGSSRSFWRKSAAFHRSACTACGGGQRAGRCSDGRHSRHSCGLELHGSLRHTWGRVTACRKSRPAPTAAKHRGLFYWSCYTPSPASRRAIRARISPAR